MSGGRIFISYRRGIDNGEARALYDQLERFFARERLFMDVDDIPAGSDFVENLDGQVARCQALIAVIGRGWVDDVDRLRDEEDFVRIEIEAALKRGDQIPIIPLLVDGMMLPERDALPEALRALRRRNGVPIRHETYAPTIEARLCPELRDALQETEALYPGTGSTGAATRPLAPATERSAAQVAPRGVPAPGTLFRDVDEDWCPEMAVIPAGTFWMGSTDEEAKRFNLANGTETPRHRVAIAEPFALATYASTPFALATYASTFVEWDACCAATSREQPADEGWGRGRRPVVNVSWNDCLAYCDWLTEMTGERYRMPSEAEWEYACRANASTAYAFGDAITPDMANFGGCRRETVPVDVRRFPANGFGLHQMHGNVWE
ncbi:MAG: SUMF1/EgtB/PvdO family nonheme iron enzyme [Pseudomonadota bacterium]